MELNRFHGSTTHLPSIPKRKAFAFELYSLLELCEYVVSIRRRRISHWSFCELETNAE